MRHKFEKKRCPSSGRKKSAVNVKSYFPNNKPPPQVDQLRQAYKEHNIKLSRKQAKRLWDIFKDCNATTLIF